MADQMILDMGSPIDPRILSEMSVSGETIPPLRIGYSIFDRLSNQMVLPDEFSYVIKLTEMSVVGGTLDEEPG